jgi:glycosyltransferase involved in cell wall biosynthesis
MSRRWIVSQIGARQHYAPARAMHAVGRLERLYTDIWAGGRKHPAIPRDHVTAFNAGAIARLLWSRRRRTHSAASYLDFIATGQWFSRRVAADLRRRSLDPAEHAALLFSTGALETLQLLRSRGVPCLVDQIDPGRVEEDIVLAECEKWPGWQPVPVRIPDAYHDRLAAEWAAADGVLVNSQWTKRALVQQGVAADKIAVVPIAYAPAAPVTPRPPRKDGTLHVLWLGQVILRKGIPYLFEAARQLRDENIRFTVAGWVGISETALASAPPNVRVIGPVARERTHQLYCDADVFVLPTLSDGFAITQLEAMSHGLPVIATDRCGEVVTDGVDGAIVPPADAAALAGAIARLAQDHARLAAMASAAAAKAMQFTLARFAEALDLTATSGVHGR